MAPNSVDVAGFMLKILTLVSSMQSMGIQVDEIEQLDVLLEGVSAPFEDLRDRLQEDGENWTTCEKKFNNKMKRLQSRKVQVEEEKAHFARLVSQHEQANFVAPSRGGSKKITGKCYGCGAVGHRIRDCPTHNCPTRATANGEDYCGYCFKKLGQVRAHSEAECRTKVRDAKFRKRKAGIPNQQANFSSASDSTAEQAFCTFTNQLSSNDGRDEYDGYIDDTSASSTRPHIAANCFRCSGKAYENLFQNGPKIFPNDVQNKKWRWRGSNQRPSGPESHALSIEPLGIFGLSANLPTLVLCQIAIVLTALLAALVRIDAAVGFATCVASGLLVAVSYFWLQLGVLASTFGDAWSSMLDCYVPLHYGSLKRSIVGVCIALVTIVCLVGTVLILCDPGAPLLTDSQSHVTQSCFQPETSYLDFADPCQEHAFLASSQNRSLSDAWLIDSGYTQHMGNDPGLFASLIPTSVSVELANTKTCPASGIGSVNLKVSLAGTVRKFQLKNVLHVPELGRNLLSVRALTATGHSVSFDSSRCFIRKGNRVVATATLIDKQYYLDSNTVMSTPDTWITQAFPADHRPQNDADLWHSRMGHLNHSDLLKGTRVVSGMTVTADHDKFCRVCASTKASRLPFPCYQGVRLGSFRFGRPYLDSVERST